MPRIQPSLLRRANRLSPHLASLLPACRDLASAQNELRWIKSHVDETWSQRKLWHLNDLCQKRRRGVPLQYILGSQPFGALDIKCKRGVLIPRPETEAYTFHLASLVKSGELLGQHVRKSRHGVNLIDFCTGTGCIPLGFFSSLQHSVENMTVRGVDISPVALRLAQENIARNIKLQTLIKPTRNKRLDITTANVFSDSDMQQLAVTHWDILVSNPPYVSEDVWHHGRGQLGYSVRKYEPRLALVPANGLPCPSGCNQADVFYARLLDISELLKPKVVLFEIGDESQARRVLQLYFAHPISQSSRVEVWRDWPDVKGTEDSELSVGVEESKGERCRVPVKGDGRIRSVLIRRLDEA
jgi:HemK-like putative methylase